MDEEKVACFMATFGISEEEARQMIADDEAIDHGADLFPLTAEQEKASKQARATGTRKTEYQFSKRERKPDPDKRCLIDLLFQSLDPQADAHPTITNPERQIDFAYNGRQFRIVLSAPRAPK
jgi:hypothetical protein